MVSREEMAEQIAREFMARFSGLDFWRLSRSSKERVCANEATQLIRELEIYFDRLYSEETRGG